MTGQIADLVASHLRDVPDFPIPGVVFRDICPLLADGPAFAAVIGELAADTGPVDLVAGVEARGFIFAAALANELGVGLVPVRKAGKLPPPTVRRCYALEYGHAEIEVPVGVLGGQRVLLVDDVLATGGTLATAAALIADAGATLTGMRVVLELTALGGRAALPDVPLRALLRV
jgi:adenine phosphoribosyltransferase